MPRRFGVTRKPFGVTPRRFDVTPRRFDVTQRRFGVTPRRYYATPRRFDVTSRRHDVTPRRLDLYKKSQTRGQKGVFVRKPVKKAGWKRKRLSRRDFSIQPKVVAQRPPGSGLPPKAMTAECGRPGRCNRLTAECSSQSDDGLQSHIAAPGDGRTPAGRGRRTRVRRRQRVCLLATRKRLEDVWP